MKKSDKIGAKFNNVLNYINEAEITLQSIKEISSKDMEQLNYKFVELVSMVEDLTYEICMPLEMEEDERAEEIRVLERRLAELKSIDCSVCVAKSGDQDSFSNLGL